MKLPGCLGQILQTQDIYKMLCGYAVVDPQFSSIRLNIQDHQSLCKASNKHVLAVCLQEVFGKHRKIKLGTFLPMMGSIHSTVSSVFYKRKTALKKVIYQKSQNLSQSQGFMSFKVLYFNLFSFNSSEFACIGRNPPQKSFTAVIRSPASLGITSTTEPGQSQPFCSILGLQKLVMKKGNCSYFSK